jgi:hypothetical protein
MGPCGRGPPSGHAAEALIMRGGLEGLQLMRKSLGGADS